MKKFYAVIEDNGEIKGFCLEGVSKDIPDTAIEIPDNIYRKHLKGEFYCYDKSKSEFIPVGQPPSDSHEIENGKWAVKSTKELKDKQKKKLKDLANERILEVYPLHKQLNIRFLDGYTEQDRDEMLEFINNIRAEVKASESVIDGTVSFTKMENEVNKQKKKE